MNLLIQWITRITMGKHLSIAITMLKMISDAIKNRDTKNVSKLVYEKLPKRWKHPEGPATEKEFINSIDSGEKFLKNLIELTSR